MRGKEGWEKGNIRNRTRTEEDEGKGLRSAVRDGNGRDAGGSTRDEMGKSLQEMYRK